MPDQKTKLDHERITKGAFVFEVLKGIAIALGLALLWSMEAVRDRFFHLLDRWHVPTMRWRRASAVPPGPSSR